MGGEHFEIAADSIELAGNKLDFDIPAKPIHLAIAKFFAVPIRLPEKRIAREGCAIIIGKSRHRLAFFINYLHTDAAEGAVYVYLKAISRGAQPFCAHSCRAGDGF